MSTTPGEHSWADAGLVPPDSTAIPRSERTTVPQDPDGLPAAPRPDLRDEAAESDVVEQYLDHEGTPAEPPRPRDDAADHDLLEQAQEVPDDDDDAYPSA